MGKLILDGPHLAICVRLRLNFLEIKEAKFSFYFKGSRISSLFGCLLWVALVNSNTLSHWRFEDSPIQVFTNSQSAHAFAYRSEFHGRMKRIEVHGLLFATHKSTWAFVLLKEMWLICILSLF